MSDSLLAPDDGQYDMFKTNRRLFFEELENMGEFTGERLIKKRPDTYKAIVVLLGQGVGVIRIGQLLGVSPNTVLAVRDREGSSIDIVKEHLAKVAHNGAALAGEGLVDQLSKLLAKAGGKDYPTLDVKELKDLAVIFGIFTTNGQLLAGEPTSRVEVSDFSKTSPQEAFNAYIESLKPAKATHLAVETPGQKGNGARPDLVPGASALPPVIDLPSSTKPPMADSQSEGDSQKDQ